MTPPCTLTSYQRIAQNRSACRTHQTPSEFVKNPPCRSSNTKKTNVFNTKSETVDVSHIFPGILHPILVTNGEELEAPDVHTDIAYRDGCTPALYVLPRECDIRASAGRNRPASAPLTVTRPSGRYNLWRKLAYLLA